MATKSVEVAATGLPKLTLEVIDDQSATVEEGQACENAHESEEREENESVASDESEMEPFEDYRPKIDELLRSIGLTDFAVSSIQHAYHYQNCVYALASRTDPAEEYILRVPGLPDFDDGGVCKQIEQDVALLRYLGNKLPVPHIKAYSCLSDNALEKPYAIQTKLRGISLNNIYDDLAHDEKLNIIDQFVQLLARIESITFPTAGTFSMGDTFEAPAIDFFGEGDEEFMRDPGVAQDRTGADLKSLLHSHINGWIRKEEKADQSFSLSSLKSLIFMVDELDREGAFRTIPAPIVLHHWDLEARNIMVEKISGSWKIQGIIDWDAALSLPRSLTRRAPDWIWDFDSEGFTGYLDNDHHPKYAADLSVQHAALKSHFDAKAAESLEGYLEDAYGQGLWLRRIWTFARGGAENMWYIDLIKQLEQDWAARPVPEILPSASLASLVERAIQWASGFVVALRSWFGV
ncbi:MAG: hypothetical protein LQ348_004644 [Seirophora lacunosa]|nr:MAG: hypothetical protein LQ348_004644 [Seirophora lacunosa]